LIPTDPQPHTRQRFSFNPRLRNPVMPARAWKLRTEKFDGREWRTIAHFPTVSKENQAEQRERMNRHAEAFGGLVRMMRGELLLASWQDGKLECDLRDEDEVGKAVE
jgi:hypothetical protein